MSVVESSTTVARSYHPRRSAGVAEQKPRGNEPNGCQRRDDKEQRKANPEAARIGRRDTFGELPRDSPKNHTFGT